jgi:hypothetical protein
MSIMISMLMPMTLPKEYLYDIHYAFPMLNKLKTTNETINSLLFRLLPFFRTTVVVLNNPLSFPVTAKSIYQAGSTVWTVCRTALIALHFPYTIAFLAEKLNLAFTTTDVFSSANLDCFSIDESISDLLPSPLQIIPESLPRNSHPVSSLILLDLKKITKSNSLKLFYG